MTYYVYILSSITGVLYIGVTNNLERRMYEHKKKLVPGFTQKYNISQLLYFQEYNDIAQAIHAEKVVKKWRRSKKLDLIRTINPYFRDLSLRSR